MNTISYEQLQKAGYTGYLLADAPERVLQFGEGHFLRAFVNYWFDMVNEKTDWKGKCLIVKPRNSASAIWKTLNDQQGLYTLYLRGIENGKTVERKRVISSVSRCVNPYESEGFEAMMEAARSDDLEYVISNTTEAGIVYDPACRLEDRPCESFPGKLTQVLFARFSASKGGLVILPCELNDRNGDMLRECVVSYLRQWKLGEAFERYVTEACVFSNTLVDRIVPGAISSQAEKEKLEEVNGYRDDAAVVSEVFGVWNIEGDRALSMRLPFEKAGLPCSVTEDVIPYKKRKVRILNGAHTGFVPGAYLAGFDIVRECMENRCVHDFMKKMLNEEIIPVLPLEKNDLESFAQAVEDRFANPFVDHALISISLNSTSKWKTRNLPSLLEYEEKFHQIPKCLCMGFAAYIAFYSCDVQALSEEGLVCRRPLGNTYVCRDDRSILEFYYEHRKDSEEELVSSVLKNTGMWGQNLTEIPGLENEVAQNLKNIRRNGAISAFSSCL